MIFDDTLMFSEGQAITATAASTNVIDLGAARRMHGGHDVPITVLVTEAFNNLTSLTVTVETDDNSGFSSATTVFTGTAIPLASLTAGARLFPPYVLPFDVAERYVRLKYTVAGTNPSTGKITAGVTAGNQTA